MAKRTKKNAAAGPTVEVAAGSGVCFGVQRALRLAEEALARHEPVYCLGPLIHNPQEMERLEAEGFHVIRSLEESESGGVPASSASRDLAKGGPRGVLIVRSHGLGPEVVEEARRRGMRIVDATCPLVRRVQTLAVDLAREGYQVVVAGEAAHPEVRAILGHAPTAKVVGDAQELGALGLDGRVALLAQTTFSPERFREMAAAVVACDLAEVRVIRTICAATVERQQAAALLAERVDVVFVVGGRNSANTNRLAELCRGRGVPTHHVEQAGEVAAEHLRGYRRVGVAAGASTPQWIIEAICRRIKALQSEVG